MKETMNIAYFVTADNRALLEASIASLKENTGDAELNISIFENSDILESLKTLECSRVMIVSPYVFFCSSIEPLYNSVDEIIPAAGVRSAISNVGEVKNYIRNSLKVNPVTYASEQLLVLNLELLKRESFFEKYEKSAAKLSYINSVEDFINVTLSGRIKMLADYLAAPGQAVKNPSAVTYAYAGKPWEHRSAEYSDIFERYSALVSGAAGGESLRQLAEKYRKYNVPVVDNELVFAM